MIDTHCHINLSHFDDDFEEMLGRAVGAGVTGLVNIGYDPDSARETRELVDEYPFIYGVAGVHPHDATVLDDAFEAELRELLQHPRFIAVGEIGLDFYRNLSPRETQYDTFRRMLRLARELDMPIVIHCRDAFDEVIQTLREEGESYRGIFHAFSGTAEEAEQVLALGFHIGIGGVVTFKNSQLARTLPSLPLDRIVLETDSPYLTPHPYRGKRNEPGYVAHVARAVADIRHLEPREIVRLTTLNFYKAMGIEREVTPTPVYKIGKRVYIHTASAGREALDALDDAEGVEELIVCGATEPLYQLDRVIDVAKAARERGWRTRLDTGGTGNQIAGHDVTPELAPAFDEIVVLFHGTTATQHDRVAYPPVGDEGFAIIKDFVRCSVAAGADTICEFIAQPKFKPEQCRELAKELGAQYDIRMYRS